VEYLELPEADQTSWLATTRQRLPRLSRWLEQLIGDSHTVTLLDKSVRNLAGKSVDRMEINAERLTVGDQLGPWEVLEEVGQGGMGRVYRGKRSDEAFEMDVAIKQIGQRRRGLAELLQRECRLLARLDHPAVTRLVDAGLDDRAGPFLVMEWIEGTDLSDWLAREQPDLETRLKLFEYIAEAVAHAHQRLIVHGDIKPDNIRIRNDGSVKLMDFGVARLLDAGEAEQAGLRALTPAFAAPEQRVGEDITPASDIWSLGALLHWLITGQVISQQPDDASNVILLISHRRRHELAAIISRACAESPESRYANSQALIDDLRFFAQYMPLQAMPNTRRYRLNRFVRRNPTLIGGVTAAVMMLVIGLVSTSLMFLQAESARQDAVTERDRAEQHAQELEQVASFQAEQFGDLDVAAMGMALRSQLMEKPTLRGTDALAEVDWTGLQLGMIDTHLLEGSQRAINTLFEDQPLVRARLLQSLAATRRALGLLEGAQSVQQQVMAITLEHAADDHPLRATALYQQGLLASRLGQLDDARDSLDKAWSLRRETLGEDHPDSLLAQRELGVVIKDLGQFSEAEGLLRDVLERRRVVLGERHPRTLDSFMDLGVFYLYQRKMEKAEEYKRIAVEGRISELGARHPDTLTAKMNLGAALRRQGQFEKAEALYRTVIDTRRELLGDNHPDTIMMITNQAVLMHTLGRLAEAEHHFRQALAGYQALMGSDHPGTANTLSNLGVLKGNQGDYEAAESYLRQSLDIRLRTLGEDHPATLQSWSSLSSALRKAGRAEEAVTMSERALEGRRTLLGPDHLQTLLSQTQHGANLRELGQLEEAEDTGANAVARAREALPSDHWRLATHLGEYGRTLTTKRYFDEARAILREAYEIMAGSLGEDHAFTQRTAGYLAELYADWNVDDPNERWVRLHSKWTDLAQVTPVSETN
jgi:eukaryotic-like serine/threonine-protein kinase